jgi:hypothetical protein
METRRARGRPIRRSARAARRAARALGDAGQRLAERLAYRPREVVVVALLATGLFGGLVIGRWRARHPTIADRLELEPVRPTATTTAAVPAPPRRQTRTAPPRCDAPDVGASVATSPAPRLDLNRATAEDLARVAGISWRLATRIIAARDALESRDTPGGPPGAAEAAGGGQPDTPGPSPMETEPASDVDAP